MPLPAPKRQFITLATGNIKFEGPLTRIGQRIVRLSPPPMSEPRRKVPINIGGYMGYITLDGAPTLRQGIYEPMHMEPSLTIEIDASLVDLLQAFYGEEYVRVEPTEEPDMAHQQGP